MTDRWR